MPALVVLNVVDENEMFSSLLKDGKIQRRQSVYRN